MNPREVLDFYRDRSKKDTPLLSNEWQEIYSALRESVEAGDAAMLSLRTLAGSKTAHRLDCETIISYKIKKAERVEAEMSELAKKYREELDRLRASAKESEEYAQKAFLRGKSSAEARVVELEATLATRREAVRRLREALAFAISGWRAGEKIDCGCAGCKRMFDVLGETAAVAQVTPASPWIDAATRKPETGPEGSGPVLVSVTNAEEKRHTTLAIWVPRFTCVDDGDNFQGDPDYCEEKDEHFWPEGWYEYSDNIETTCWKIDGTVTHWMPMPDKPEQGGKEGA